MSNVAIFWDIAPCSPHVKPTLRRNVLPPSSGSKIGRTRNQRVAGGYAMRECENLKSYIDVCGCIWAYTYICKSPTSGHRRGKPSSRRMSCLAFSVTVKICTHGARMIQSVWRLGYGLDDGVLGAQ
jgi:hypothetical protein